MSNDYIPVKEALLEHLKVAGEMCRAINSPNIDTFDPSRMFDGDNLWRQSNLIRHHLVAIPLLNYTDFSGNLAVHAVGGELKLDNRKIEWSPRFVHFDECLGLIDSGFVISTESDLDVLTEDDSISFANKLYAKFHGSGIDDVKSEVVILGSSN